MAVGSSSTAVAPDRRAAVRVPRGLLRPGARRARVDSALRAFARIRPPRARSASALNPTRKPPCHLTSSRPSRPHPFPGARSGRHRHPRGASSVGRRRESERGVRRGRHRRRCRTRRHGHLAARLALSRRAPFDEVRSPATTRPMRRGARGPGLIATLPGLCVGALSSRPGRGGNAGDVNQPAFVRFLQPSESIGGPTGAAIAGSAPKPSCLRHRCADVRPVRTPPQRRRRGGLPQSAGSMPARAPQRGCRVRS
jgi:hypothetical protein